MPHVVTLKSVVISTPVIEKGKPLMDEAKFGGRKVTFHVHDHVQHEAGVQIEVSEEIAKELIEAGHAREQIVGVDEVEAVDPTKPPSDDVLG